MNGSDCFAIDKIDKSTYIKNEYKHWEETHRYPSIEEDRRLLIDTEP